MTGQDEGVAFNPDDYTREYRYPKKDRYIYATACIALLLCAVIYFMFFYTRGTDDLWVMFACGIIALAPFGIIYPLTTVVTLHPEYIEHRVFRIFKRRLKRDEIVGWRSYKSENWPRWLRDSDISLVSNNKCLGSFNVNGIEQDRLFEAWCKSLPDYQALHREMMAKATLAEKTLIYANSTAAFLAVLLIFYVYPKSFLPPLNEGIVLFLGLLPILPVFLAIKYPARFTFFAWHRNPPKLPKYDLFAVYFIPLWLLSMWFLLRDDGVFLFGPLESLLIGLPTIIVFAVLISGYFLPLIIYKNFYDARKTITKTIILIPVLFFGSIGTACTFNIVLDRSAPVVYQSTVVAKEITKDTDRIFPERNFKIAVRSLPELDHLIGIAPGKNIRFEVNPDFYKKTETGDAVCISEYQGLFGPGWLKLDHCPVSDLTGERGSL